MDIGEGLVRFSTRNMGPANTDVPPVEEVYSSVTRMNIASANDAPLDVEMALRLLPNVNIASVSTSPYRIERTHAQTIDGNDDLVLTVAKRSSVSGIVVRQAGREVEFDPGEACLWLSDRKLEAIAPLASNILNITVPRQLIEPLVADIDVFARERVPNSMELTLLASYAEGLLADTPLTPEIAVLAGSHMRDLIVATLGAKPAAKRRGEVGGVRAARLDAIKRDVLGNLSDPTLSIDTMAMRHGISPHYIRALFNGDGMAFTDYVREQRLRAAFRQLIDGRSVHLSISAVAYGCGFSDLSWFNQAFKRRFGRTPSDVRQQG